MLSFAEADGAIVGAEQKVLTGETPGWTGTPESSPLVAGTLSAVAPEKADHLVVSILSHNAENVVGALAIDDMGLSIESADGESRTVEFFPLDLPDDAAGSMARPRGWLRAGTSPRMNTVGIRNTPEPHAVLVLTDDDPTRFGNWSTASGSERVIACQPGDRVTLRWRASHSLGLGGTATARYQRLAPGTYWFRVGTFRPNGEPGGSEISVPVEVFVPLHLRHDVWAMGGMATVIGGVFAARSLATLRMKRRLEELERAHAVERERSRIARDLHDDIGSALTEIAMQADSVRTAVREGPVGEAEHLAEGICRSAVDLVRNVDAIVWAVNPAHDTLDRFVTYIVQSTEQFLDSATVAMRFDIPEEVPHRMLDGTVRHRLLMAVREALHNVVKHAQASTVTLAVRFDHRTLEIEVRDDGRGFDLEGVASSDLLDHDGLENMRQRMVEIGGTCAVDAGVGTGTRVRFRVPVAEVGRVARRYNA